MFKALLKGESLKNPAFWKRLQLALNILGSIAPIILTVNPELHPYLGENALVSYYTVIAALNAFFIPATSTKIGF